MIAILLALASSVVYGLSDFLGGLKSRSLPQLSVLLISQASALVLLITIVVAVGAEPPSGRFILYGALAGLAEAVAVTALYRGLAIGSISIVAAIAATAPVLPVLASLTVGQAPTPLQDGGIALAVAGVILTSRARRRPTPTGASIAPSVAFGLLAAAGFGSFYIAMRVASQVSVPWALLAARLTTVTLFLAAIPITRPRLAVAHGDLPVLALIGTLIVGADSMYAIATTHGRLAVVAVLSSLYPLVTIGLARLYLHEHLAALQRIGVAICLCGSAAISAQ